MQKSTVDEIRERFDADVERFSSLETGQASAVDSPLCMDLLTTAAARVCPQPREVLDIGCGAGNYTLSLLSKLGTPPAEIRLLDLSLPMLERAEQRIRATGFSGAVTSVQGDVRQVQLGRPDIVLAAAVFHHLRSPSEWEAAASKLFEAMVEGAGLWVYDMVDSEIPAVRGLMHERYGRYLSALKDDAYRDHVFEYIEKEDTPAPLTFQVELFRQHGFAVDVLHANTGFAAYGAVKLHDG